MSAEVIQLPDPVRLRASRHAVKQRAVVLGATPSQVRRALHVVLVEMQAGRSSGAAVAMANTSLRPVHLAATGGDAA